MPHSTRPRGDDVPQCAECGQRHLTRYGTQSCAGHVRYDRATYVPGKDREPLDQPRPCERPPNRGISRCGSHGGGTEKAKAAGRRREQQVRAEALMVTLGEPIEDVDPGEIIARRIAVRYGHAEWLLTRVRELEPDALTWGLTKRKTGVARDVDSDDGENTERRTFAGTDEGDTHEAKPHIWYGMYLDASRDLEKLCIEAIRVGLDERRVRMAEQQADMWVRMIDGVLADLGHDPNDPATADVVARRLEAVA